MYNQALREAVQDYLDFNGGLDQVTPSWSVKPGSLRTAQNYEIDINGGYKDIVGYERFDGRPSPSDAEYAILDVEVTGSVEDGDTVTGADSSATGVVVAVVVSSEDSYLVLTKVTGTFQAEVLNVSASPEANSLGAQAPGGASTAKLNAQYRNIAADSYRGDIDPPTGSGGILGLMRLDGVEYAFRNAADGLSANLWKESTSGWVQVDLGRQVDFTSGGTYVVVEGNTITGATSAATAVVERVILRTGTFAGGDAAGTLILSGQTGTFQSENLNVGASTNVATIAGNSTAITLAPDGQYDIDYSNFGGATGEIRAYGVDGENKGFEFDGAVYVPITTGMAVDKPNHVRVHKNHLIYSFGQSIQTSGIGTPYLWSVILGASELLAGDDVTAFMPEPGTAGGAALGVYCRNIVHILYGSDSTDWTLVTYRTELGAYPFTVQQLGQTLYLDDRGISNLSTSQSYGNFQHSTLSKLIQPTINAKRSTATASCIVRNKNQYRLFFSDGSGLYITFAGSKVMGIMPVQFPDPITCMHSVEDADGTEKIFFGSSDGNVYQAEVGTSFDGDSIEAFFSLHFHFSKMLRRIKRYLSATIEASGSGYAEFSFTHELGYASTEISQPNTDNIIASFSDAVWDTGVWDVFVWDGQSLSPSYAKLEGSAENISITIKKTSDYYLPVRFSGSLIRLLTRAQMR